MLFLASHGIVHQPVFQLRDSVQAFVLHTVIGIIQQIFELFHGIHSK